jgi:hypothetical protein
MYERSTPTISGGFVQQIAVISPRCDRSVEEYYFRSIAYAKVKFRLEIFESLNKHR